MINKNRKIIDIVVIIVVSLILSIPLLNSSFYLYNNDGLTTISRAYESLKSIEKNGFFSQNVLISLANNFGYSWSLFSGSLPTFIIMIFTYLFKNIIIAYKFSVIVFLVLSGIGMYKFTYVLTDNRDVSLLTSILYIVFPYHLFTIYSRNNFDEFMVFVFLPYVFMGAYNIINNKGKTFYLAIGLIGLLLSNNVMFICTVFFVTIYFLFFTKKIGKQELTIIVWNVIIVLFITSFYWYPNLSVRVYGDYHIDNMSKEEIKADTLNSGLRITQLFVTRDEDYTVWELGPHIIIMLAFSWFALKNIKEEYKKNYLFFLIMGICSVLMSTRYFPWKIFPAPFLFLKPWKLVEFMSVFFSIICGLNMYTLIKKFNLKDVLVISFISILYLGALLRFIPIMDSVKNVSEYKVGVITGKENEYVNGMDYLSYLPEKAYNNRFYIATREDSIMVLDGDVSVSGVKKVGTKYTANIETKEENNRLELPFIYYPGYEIRYDGMIVDGYETENGFLGIDLKKDNGELSVNYKGTKGMRNTMLLSIISFMLLVVMIIVKNKKRSLNS